MVVVLQDIIVMQDHLHIGMSRKEVLSIVMELGRAKDIELKGRSLRQNGQRREKSEASRRSRGRKRMNYNAAY